jgi:hypothetical protein
MGASQSGRDLARFLDGRGSIKSEPIRLHGTLGPTCCASSPIGGAPRRARVDRTPAEAPRTPGRAPRPRERVTETAGAALDGDERRPAFALAASVGAAGSLQTTCARASGPGRRAPRSRSRRTRLPA